MSHEPTKKNLAEELEGLLLKINNGNPAADLRRQATELISTVSPTDIAQAEDRLMRNGLSARRVQQLSAAFILMGLMDAQKGHLRDRLAERHVLKKVLAEHEILRCWLADLEEVALQIGQAEGLTETSIEIHRLAHITEHLAAMQEHIDRENDVIFPALRAQGWDSLCHAAEADHVFILTIIGDLVKLIQAFRAIPFSTFKQRLPATVKILCPLIREHLFHEDQVLYPVAVALIDKDGFWEKIKHVCDEIDYCGIHL